MLYVPKEVQEKLDKAKEFSKLVEKHFLKPEMDRLRAECVEMIAEQEDWTVPTWARPALKEGESTVEWVERYVVMRARENTKFSSLHDRLEYVAEWGQHEDNDKSLAILYPDFTDHSFVTDVYLPGHRRLVPRQVVPVIAQHYQISQRDVVNDWGHAITMGIIYYGGPKTVEEFESFEMPKYYWGWNVHS